MSQRRNFFKRHHIKSYERRNFENPFFKKKKTKPWKIVVLTILIIGAILGSIGYLIYGPLFKITTIEIQGLTTIPVEDVQKSTWSKIDDSKFSIVPRNHSLFLKSKKLMNELSTEFDFETIEISAKGNLLTIMVKERISELIWRSDRNFYFIGFDGVIQREFRPSELNSIFTRLNMPLSAPEDGSEPVFAPLQPNVPIIEDKSKTSVEIGDRINLGETVENVLKFDQELRRLSLEPVIYEINSRHELWLRAVTTSTFTILFEGARDIDDQIDSLAVALEESKDSLAEIQYIDVRFEGRIYIK